MTLHLRARPRGAAMGLTVSVGVVVAPFGRLRYVASITIAGSKIAQIHVMADPAVLRQLHLSVLPD